MLTKLKQGSAAAFVAVVTVGLWSGIASAEPADPLGEGTTDLQAGIESYISDYGLPMLVALLILGIGIALFMKFGRKAKGAV